MSRAPCLISSVNAFVQSVTSSHLGLVHFWRLSWGSRTRRFVCPSPVCCTRFFCARINNLWQVWTKGSLGFLVVRLLFHFLLRPFGSVALLLAHYLKWISRHFLFVSPSDSPSIRLSKFHSVCLLRNLPCCSGKNCTVVFLCLSSFLRVCHHPAPWSRWIFWRTVLMLEYFTDTAG